MPSKPPDVGVSNNVLPTPAPPTAPAPPRRDELKRRFLCLIVDASTEMGFMDLPPRLIGVAWVGCGQGREVGWGGEG